MQYNVLICFVVSWAFSITLNAQITFNKSNASTYSDSYSPAVKKTLKPRTVKICADSVIVTPREVIGPGPCRQIIGTRIVYDTLRKVDTRVDKVPAYLGGYKKFKAGLNNNLKFTQKDVKYKAASVYKIYVLIDETGKVAGVEYIDGKKDDNFYPRLVEQIFKLDNWKPAIAGKETVPYKMPLVILLKPSLEGNYIIDIAHPLTVKTVFESYVVNQP
jgi:hypothetical protein